MAPPSPAVGDRVCVVGAGASGLIAIKNLKEQGLQVTAYERNDFIGGLWHFSPRTDQTTAMPGTRTIQSKQVVSRLINCPPTDLGKSKRLNDPSFTGSHYRLSIPRRYKIPVLVSLFCVHPD